MIDAADRTLKILHLALMMSLGIYAFILYQVSQNQAPHELPPMFLHMLAGVALMETVIIAVLRGKMLPPTREAASLSEPVPEGAAVQQAMGRVFTASILSWALSESIAIYGLILSFISFELKYYFAFAGLSVVNFLIYRPRKELLLGAARATVAVEGSRAA